MAGMRSDMYTIYALEFDDGRWYTGMTENLARRIREHKRGKTRSTKNKTIVRVLKLEVCDSGIQARKREKYWKSSIGREQVKKYSGVEQSGSSLGS